MTTPRLLVALSALIAAPVAAEAPKPAAAEVPKPAAAEANPAPAPRLNLRLDNAARYSREVPREDAGGGTLPGLGSEARPLPERSFSKSMDETFPKDSVPGR